MAPIGGRIYCGARVAGSDGGNDSSFELEMENSKGPPMDLMKELKELGQEHLLSFWSTLRPSERRHLLSDIKDVDFRRLRFIHHQSTSPGSDDDVEEQFYPVQNVATIEGRTAADVERWREVGLEAITKGKLAVLLLAGGQGTRLGSSEPKGCFDIGLPSSKSLFQLQAERILRVQCMAAATASSDGGKVEIPWFIMTSPFTHAATVSYFKLNGYFGLELSQVFLFSQGTLPCLDESGRVILEKPYQIARAPDGNGGVYEALKVSGSLEEMERRGVCYVDCYCVDNALVRVADPVYLGLAIERQAPCANKVVKKAYPEEKVGVFARRGVDGPTVVVEYTELDPSLASSSDPVSGKLIFNWSNICIHLFSLNFLKTVINIFSQKARYHVAKKKIPSVGDGGAILGIKLEHFIFDAFLHAPSVTLMEVEREEEFSPVKNPVGSATESPDIAKNNLLKMHGRWVMAAGGKLEPAAVVDQANDSGGGGSKDGWGVEISPLLSHAGEDLEPICRGKIFKHSSEISEANGITNLV